MSTDRTPEIMNYLSAMSRDIGEFRTETRTQISELRTGLDNLRTEVRTGFSELRGEVSALTTRFDRLEARVLDNRADVRELDARVKALESKQA